MVFGAACVVAVGGGDEDIHYTKRGAETTVAVPIGRAFEAGRRAFAEMGIRRTEAELERENDEEREESEGEVEGKRADLKVKVTLKARGRGPTRVRVVAKREDLGWDRDFARAVLERIVVLAY